MPSAHLGPETPSKEAREQISKGSAMENRPPTLLPPAALSHGGGEHERERVCDRDAFSIGRAAASLGAAMPTRTSLRLAGSAGLRGNGAAGILPQPLGCRSAF
jgi:hypothetical protein